MIESTCPLCGAIHLAPVPVTQFACCPNGGPVVVDSSLKQTIRRTAQRHFVENRVDRPGDWVGKLIKHHFGIDPPKGCRCREVQNEMNRLGWAKCLEEIDRLAGRLKDNAKEFGWDVTIVAAFRAVATGAMSWLDPFDPWRSLVREACRRAKEDCQAADIGRADWWGAET